MGLFSKESDKWAKTRQRQQAANQRWSALEKSAAGGGWWTCARCGTSNANNCSCCKNCSNRRPY